MTNRKEPVLVLGVGNILVGDEGVGVHLVQKMQQQDVPAGVEIVDGGTGGFHLLELLGRFQRIILVDATRDGNPAGTVRQFSPRLASDFPPSLGAHDIGLNDLISAAALLGPLPDMTVVTISIKELKPMTMELSEEVGNAIPEAIGLIHKILEDAN
ncbi:MAG: hydrogenase maturation protease [Puniceicoccaceae bacterium]